ncbi:MAG TPA: hypothetical protein VIV60_34330, partial [Polyangiaceae bacterium]
PLASTHLVDPEGQANVSTYLLGSSAEASWLNTAFASGAAGLGASVLLTDMSGQANLGYAGATDTVITVAPVVYLKLRARITPTWSAFASVLSGASVPEVRVKFDDRSVASWGQPFVLVTLGIDVRCLAW